MPALAASEEKSDRMRTMRRSHRVNIRESDDVFWSKDVHKPGKAAQSDLAQTPS